MQPCLKPVKIVKPSSKYGVATDNNVKNHDNSLDRTDIHPNKSPIPRRIQFWLVVISIIINPLAFDMFYWSEHHITQWISDLYRISPQSGYNYTNIMSSAYILGVFISQILWSIIFSRGQRRTPFMAGILIIAGASILGIISNNWIMQILSRTLIGVGVACELTAVIVLISDWYICDTRQLNYSYSIISLVSLLGSLCTPFLSVLLISLFNNWKIIYLIILIYCTFMTYGIYRNIDYQNSASTGDIGSYTIPYNVVLNLAMNVKMLQQIIINSLSFSNITIFYTSATFVFMHTYNTSTEIFSILMTINILGAILGSIINTYCHSKKNIQQMLYWAIQTSLFTILITILLHHLHLLTLLNIEILLFILAICSGIIIANTTSGFVLASQKLTSISAGLSNIIRFGFSLLSSIILIPIITMYKLSGILYLILIIIALQACTLYSFSRKNS